MASNSTTNPAPNPMINIFNDALWNNTTTSTSTSSSSSAYIGQVIMWSGPASKATATIGSSWLVCDGSAKSKSTYPLLYALLGDIYGTATSTDFYLPSFTSSFPIAPTNTETIKLTYNGVSANAGGDTNISVAQLPSHNHSTNASQITSVNGTSKTDGVGSAVGQVNYNSNITTNSTGSGQQFLPPFQCINFYIKAQ